MKNKIVNQEELTSIVNKLKEEDKKIAHCHGVFDLLHPGHFKHFEAAKQFGDILIVSITEDKHVNKGPDRPIFNEQIRAETIAAIGVVDYLFINRNSKAIPVIELIKPDFYVKGQDYEKMAEDITGGIYEEKNEVEKHGGKLVFTHEEQFSSSKLINRHIDIKDDELNTYLKKIRAEFEYNSIQNYFEEISKYNVLVIGDIILDEYQFVSPLGKSSKSATITAKKLDTELYAGGVLAVANHIADFVNNVTLVSSYGLNDSINYHDFIKDNLHKNIKFNPLFIAERPTTLKRRLVEKTFKQKLFEVIEIDDSPLSIEQSNELIKKIDEFDHYDAIIVTDFGHGLLDKKVVAHLENKNNFLAVNAQTNSANKGFNFIIKYQNCDYFSIDKEEARLAVHDKYADINSVLNNLINKTNAKLGAITLGVEGSLVGNKKTKTQSPVLSNEVVDTIGAGDAFLAITALLAKAKVSNEQIAFIGNAVGSMAVKIIGNKTFIKKVPLLKYIKTLLS